MSYSYIDFIKTPTELGISDNGTIQTLQNDIDGLIAYAKLLFEGPSKASKAPGNGILGNKFFVKTAGKCNGMTGATIGLTGMTGTGSQDRYFYVNNMPLGLIPTTGRHDPGLRGLIPGMTTNLEILDPSRISTALSGSSNPDCAQITMATVGNTGSVGSETQYVALSDIQNLDPCLFGSKGINPITKTTCEYFTNKEVDEESDTDSDDGVEYSLMDIITNDIQNDYISQLFIASFSLFGIYLFYSIIKKSKR